VAVDRAWLMIGDKGQRHLSQAFRFNHLLDLSYSQKLVLLTEAEFNVH